MNKIVAAWIFHAVLAGPVFGQPAAGQTAAEGFIVCCATGLSMSGIDCAIRFHDGRVVDSAVFLRRKLAQFATLVAKGAH
ncbi:MAG: hypothetical protein KGJ32_11875 [Xanthomonadaceae bacterium]|nr:hypothetical protein [Xanthomonadaceae bacterium]